MIRRFCLRSQALLHRSDEPPTYESTRRIWNSITCVSLRFTTIRLVPHTLQTINWGDGTPLVSGSDLTISRASRPGPNAFVVQAPHTYAKAGKFPVSTTIDDAGGARVIVENVAIITSGSLAVAGRNLRTTTGT